MIATAPTPGGVAIAAMVSEKPSIDVAVVARIVVADRAIGIARSIDVRSAAPPSRGRSLPAVAICASAVASVAVAAIAVVARALRAAGSSCQDHEDRKSTRLN